MAGVIVVSSVVTDPTAAVSGPLISIFWAGILRLLPLPKPLLTLVAGLFSPLALVPASLLPQISLLMARCSASLSSLLLLFIYSSSAFRNASASALPMSVSHWDKPAITRPYFPESSSCASNSFRSVGMTRVMSIPSRPDWSAIISLYPPSPKALLKLSPAIWADTCVRAETT